MKDFFKSVLENLGEGLIQVGTRALAAAADSVAEDAEATVDEAKKRVVKTRKRLKTIAKPELAAVCSEGTKGCKETGTGHRCVVDVEVTPSRARR